LVLLAFASQPLSGQQGIQATADSLLSAGELSSAEALYDTILEESTTIQALLGRATARAWSGRFDAAQEDFDAVLAIEPGNPQALDGAGWAMLWAGRYVEGEEIFASLLARNPENFEAEKGLALAALWKGTAPAAVLRFRALAERYPDRPDALVGLAESLLADGRPREALEAAEAAGRVGPGRPDVVAVRRAARRAPAPLEVSMTVGQTRFDDVPAASGTGVALRSVDLVIRPTRWLSMSAQYDDGISVDTRALALAGQGVPTYGGAAVATWAGRLITRGGARTRSLPAGARQLVFELDQAVVLGRVGLTAGWSGLTSDAGPSEHAFRTGLQVAAGPSWELGATVHMRAVDAVRDGFSFVPTVTRKFDLPIDVLAGMALGRPPQVDGSQHEAFLHLAARPWGGSGFTLTVRRQFGSSVEPFTVLAGGITVGLGRG
jgi:tetratricopeptide (TPR) repeat protein